MKTDFSQLYSRLGLQPGCSLLEFKQAYRRQFARLHPDRPGASGLAPEAQEQLREIISMYGSALTFHRLHGRLPGAVPATETRVAAPSPARQSMPLTVLPSIAESADDAPPTTRRRTLALAVLGACVLASLAVWSASSPTVPTVQTPAPAINPLPTAEPATSAQLELDMDMASVRAIQGEPIQMSGDRWDYGPSWLRFEEGRLVDWYSSPLYRLRTETRRPTRSIKSAAES